MGILERMSGSKCHDLWLSPMIVVPKKDGSPKRVEDFSKLNKLCKRSESQSMDTQRMAVSVPVAEKGSEILFSSLDAWNGYHSVPLEESSRNYFGFLSEFGMFRYVVAPQGFLDSGDHYVSTYDSL